MVATEYSNETVRLTGNWQLLIRELDRVMALKCNEYAVSVKNTAELPRDVSEFEFIQAIDHTKYSVDQPHITALSAPQTEESKKSHSALKSKLITKKQQAI